MLNAVLRGCQLLFFAIFIKHFYTYNLDGTMLQKNLLSLCAFLVLWPMFMRLPIKKLPEWGHLAIKVGAYVVAALMLMFTDYAGDKTFSLYNSNIIILLMANVAVFGSIVYVFTMKNWWGRVIFMAAFCAFWLSATVDGSWTQKLWNWSPCDWAVRFSYIRKILVVIPGSIAGDMLYQWMNRPSDGKEASKCSAVSMMLLSLGIIIACLVCLYNRWSFAAFATTGVLLIAGWYVVRNLAGSGELWKNLWILAACMLVVGLLLEPFQDGIKKANPTISYFFISGGLATCALIFFHVICDYFACRKSTSWLVMPGQNPMLAYVAMDLLVWPVLHITGLSSLLSVFKVNPWMGFLQGIVLTSLPILVTMYFTKKKWFWRT